MFFEDNPWFKVLAATLTLGVVAFLAMMVYSLYLAPNQVKMFAMNMWGEANTEIALFSFAFIVAGYWAAGNILEGFDELWG